MSRKSAALVIKGMAFGFLTGVLSSLKFTGVLCYQVGAIIFIIALILLAGRKRTLAATAALLIILSNIVPAYSSVADFSDEWQDPYQAYGIQDKSLQGYIALTDAMNASPPMSMDLTLIAVGVRNFDESGKIENQQVLALDGESPTFGIDSPEFSEFKFTSAVNLFLEDDGWYADSITQYSVNNAWTNYEREEGLYGNYFKCYFSYKHLGAASYLFEQYLEDGKVYVTIPISFAYGDVMGQSKADSASEIFARVDRVKRAGSETGGSKGYAGLWELKEIKSYFIERTRNSYRLAETHEFINEYSGNDPTYDTLATVSGNTLNFKIITDYPALKEVTSLTAEFGELPQKMPAFETLRITANTSAYYEDQIKNVRETIDSVPVSVGFLPGLRPEQFNTTESDTDTIAYPLGYNLGEIWFENIDGGFQAAVPQGQEEGELLTVSPYDATASRHLGKSAIAYIYEWNMKGVIPGGSEGEEDEDEAAASDDGWWTGSDTDEEWSEHASEESTDL